MPEITALPITDEARAELSSKLESWQQKGMLALAIDHWKYVQKTWPDEGNVARLKLIAAWLNKRGLEHFHADVLDAALADFTLALRAQEDDVAALNNAALCLKEMGRLDESTSFYERARALQPGFTEARSNLLMNMHYKSGVTPAMLAAAHRGWDEKHAAGLPKFQSWNSTPAPERPLRIGIVSADLGQHPVGVFLVRILENLDHAQFIVTGYVDGRRDGALTARIRKSMQGWRDVHSLNDEDLAKAIHADGIDILIDLSGHTAENRLGVFARKPAPVQVSWLGYPGDTGLSAIDYIIADRLIYPESLQPFSRARIRHLPDCFACFDPPTDAPPVGLLPARAPGQVTFGCLNNPAKCGEEVIDLWAEILAHLPQARLALKYKGFGESSCRVDFEKRFAARGIGADRLSFAGASKLPELFEFMQGIDIALDPFPFAGGLMTCLTLWMGVPVLTLPGETFASRQGLSFLSAIGITETIATSREDYLAKAVALANDLPRLGGLRQRLRPAMAASPLCDGTRAAAGLQDLLRDVWRNYCE